MERHRHADNLSFWEAIKNEGTRCQEVFSYQHRVYSYIDRGFYLKQLRRLWVYFPEEQVLILKHKELRSAPNDALEKIWKFLGVHDFPIQIHKKVHALPYEAPMNKRERGYLKQVF